MLNVYSSIKGHSRRKFVGAPISYLDIIFILFMFLVYQRSYKIMREMIHGYQLYL